jgi:integrase
MFFADAMRSIDAEAPAASEIAQDELLRYRDELENRLALYNEKDPLDERDHLIGTEIAVLRSAGFRVDPMSQARALLRRYLQRALVQVETIRLARLDGDFSVAVTDDLFREGRPEFQRASLTGIGGRSAAVPAGLINETIGKVAQNYEKQLLRTIKTRKTEDRYKSELRHIVSFFGADTPIWTINSIECDRFRDTFSLLPPNFEDKIRKGASIASIVADRAERDPTLAWATLDKYLSQLTRFLRWAHKRDYLSKSYGDDLKPLDPKPDGSVAKLPFDDDELERIFLRPIYTGCRDDRYGFAKPGDGIVRRARYWAPLIALFSGLRCGEILQLTTDHFRVSPAGNDFILLTADMKLKNENAVREIPVHPMLKSIGLIEWVNRRREAAPALLFPEVPAHSKYDDKSSRFSKWYESDLKHFELGARRAKLTFHSFRHTFKRGLDRADVREDKKEEICGWSRGKKMGRRYGLGLEADVLQASVDAVRYDVDLTHLYAHAMLID